MAIGKVHTNALNYSILCNLDFLQLSLQMEN